VRKIVGIAVSDLEQRRAAVLTELEHQLSDVADVTQAREPI
jgi:hypothetical protein